MYPVFYVFCGDGADGQPGEFFEDYRRDFEEHESGWE